MAQAGLNRRFHGLVPEDFGDNVCIFCCHDVQPPPGFHEIWRPLLPGVAPDLPGGLGSLTTVLVLASPFEDSHLHSIDTLLTLLGTADVAGKGTSALYWVLHAPATVPTGAVDSAIYSLLAAGVSGVIDEELDGLDLLLEFRFITDRARATAAAFNLVMQHRKHYLEHLESTRWNYLPRRLGLNIPPIDTTLGGKGVMSLPGYTFGACLKAGAASIVYDLEEACGFGGAGGGAGRRQVVKVMRKARFAQIEDIFGLKQSLDAMHLLSDERWQHRNLVLLNQVYHSSTRIFLRMDHGGQHNLAHWLNTLYAPGVAHGPEPVDVGAIARQLVGVVAHLHLGPHICHRNINAHNLVLDFMPMVTIKLVDFGAARVQNDGELCYTHCGTVPFIAPEVMMHAAYDGMAADIWGEGIVLFQALCGCRAADQLLAMPGPQLGGAIAPRRSCSKEHGAALVARFSQVDFMERMLRLRGHPKLGLLLPLVQPLISGMCTAVVGQRLSARGTLDAVQPLDMLLSGNSNSPDDSTE